MANPKFLDQDGVSYLWSKIAQTYTDSETLDTIIEEIKCPEFTLEDEGDILQIINGEKVWAPPPSSDNVQVFWDEF